MSAITMRAHSLLARLSSASVARRSHPARPILPERQAIRDRADHSVNIADKAPGFTARRPQRYSSFFPTLYGLNPAEPTARCGWRIMHGTGPAAHTRDGDRSISACCRISFCARYFFIRAKPPGVCG